MTVRVSPTGEGGGVRGVWGVREGRGGGASDNINEYLLVYETTKSIGRKGGRKEAEMNPIAAI